MRFQTLTHPRVVISLLTPTQDLVFVQSEHGHAVGGGFRDLTVGKDGRCQSGSRGTEVPSVALTDIPCNPIKASEIFGAPRIT